MNGQIKKEQTNSLRHKASYKPRFKPSDPKTESNSTSTCGNCGGNHRPRMCLAYGCQCTNCAQFNYYSRVCRSKCRPKGGEAANQIF